MLCPSWRLSSSVKKAVKRLLVPKVAPISKFRMVFKEPFDKGCPKAHSCNVENEVALSNSRALVRGDSHWVLIERAQHSSILRREKPKRYLLLNSRTSRSHSFDAACDADAGLLAKVSHAKTTTHGKLCLRLIESQYLSHHLEQRLMLPYTSRMPPISS